jgi:hypothetical protein
MGTSGLAELPGPCLALLGWGSASVLLGWFGRLRGRELQPAPYGWHPAGNRAPDLTYSGRPFRPEWYLSRRSVTLAAGSPMAFGGSVLG